MGEVYRAHDSKLKREVALKVLPESHANDADALARFEREALAVAALSHPNILSIFDFGSHDGVAYAVTELLEGGTLRARLEAGPVAQKEAVGYALQIVSGLAAAHEKGIVHRDLKPENLFVTRDGRLKILDFGLAKRTETSKPEDETNAPTASQHTEPGTVMGTAGYMSPEQVRGHLVDHRSDIFSFGSILYEVLSGKRAFRQETAVETLAAILKEEPPELSESGRTVSAALGHIVKRCLEKSPDRRFQSAHDLAFAIEELSSRATSVMPAPARAERRPRGRLVLAAGALALIAAALMSSRLLRRQEPGTSLPTTGSAPPAKAPRLVVLPFENLGKPEDLYFAAGMTEEIISRLTTLRGVKVISRTTAVGYDRKGKSIAQIGAELAVDFVLEGTVRWERGQGRESRVRITPQLIQVADDTHLWGERYDRVLADVFEIQSEVAENVVRAMGVQLLPREKTALQTASTTDMEAYDLYLRGLELARRSQNRQDQEGAIRLFQAAVEKDPRFAPALGQLAKAHLYISFMHDDRSVAHVGGAKDALARLVALGPDLAETHVALAYDAYWRRLDYPSALQEFRAALVLQPSSTDVIQGIGSILRRQGQWSEAAEYMARWLELDPRSADALSNNGTTDLLLRRYAEADRMLSLGTSVNPQFGKMWARRAWVQVLWRGDVQKARSILSEGAQVDGLVDEETYFAWAWYRVALAAQDLDGALQMLESERLDAFSNQWTYRPVELLRAEVHALSGRTDEARRWFEAARRRLHTLASGAPEDARYQSALGIALAGLDRRDEALRAAHRGVELMPISKDAWRGPWRVEDLALVHSMLGQEDEAIARLEHLLASTGEASTHVLRLDPVWDPLRTNPRFRALLARHADKR
jgi:TolB-like protein/Tfp pilus assembly protein PilF